MKKIATASQLLVLELGRLLSGEEAILRSLSSVVERAKDPRLRSVLEEHRRETRHHVSNLSEALHELTGAEESLPAEALESLDAELESSLARIAPEASIELGDLALIAAARRIEAYEIASYESLELLAGRIERSYRGVAYPAQHAGHRLQTRPEGRHAKTWRKPQGPRDDDVWGASYNLGESTHVVQWQILNSDQKNDPATCNT